MVRMSDIYDVLDIGNGITPFDNFFSRGVLRLRYKEELKKKNAHAKPIYIVETMGSGQLGEPVSVYAAKPAVDANNDPILDSHGRWKAYKNYTIKYEAHGIDKRDNYNDKTILSRLVRGYKVKPDKKDMHKVKVWDKPLFYTNVEKGVDSITGKEGLGFYDYSTRTGANGETIEETPTGVFICFADIDWSLITARPTDMLNYIQETKEQNKNANPFQEKLPDNLNRDNPYFHVKW